MFRTEPTKARARVFVSFRGIPGRRSACSESYDAHQLALPALKILPRACGSPTHRSAESRPWTHDTLYRMKRDTVRPIDRADAAALREKFTLGDE
jgi:hypothetical protein